VVQSFDRHVLSITRGRARYAEAKTFLGRFVEFRSGRSTI
jgi:hypothetical protein